MRGRRGWHRDQAKRCYNHLLGQWHQKKTRHLRQTCPVQEISGATPCLEPREDTSCLNTHPHPALRVYREEPFITRSCWQRLVKPFPSVPSAYCLGTACAGVLPTYWLPNWEWGEPSTLNKRMRGNSGQLFGKLFMPGPTSPVMPMHGHLLGQDLFAGLWRRLERSAHPCHQAAGPRTPTHHWEGGKLPSDTPGAKEVTRYLFLICYGAMQHL